MHHIKKAIISTNIRPEPVNSNRLTGKRKSSASQAAWRTTLVGYIGPPGDVKLYKQVFSLVLVAILSSNPVDVKDMFKHQLI